MSVITDILDFEFAEVARNFGLSAESIDLIERDVREYHMLFGPITIHDVLYAKFDKREDYQSELEVFFKKINELPK